MKKTRILTAAIMTGTLALAPLAHAEEQTVKPVKFVGAAESSESNYQSSTAVSDKPAASPTSYPESASVHSFQQELFEIRRAEEAERKAIKARDDYERKKAETEREVAARKYKIEGLKLRQDQLSSEMEAINTDIKDIDKNYKETEQELLATEKATSERNLQADNVRKEMTDSKQKLEGKIEVLRTARELAQKNINKNSIEFQRMKAEVATLEAEADALEAQSTNLQANELQTRTEWMAIKAQIEEKSALKAKQFTILDEAKKKYEAAQKDFKVAQVELAQAEKSRNETEAKVSAEVKKLDQSTYAAQRAKAMAEAEKIRMEAEAEKLRYYISSVKKTNAEAVEAMRDSQSQVMESRLALETAKSELTSELAGGDRIKSKHDKRSASLRGLAAVAEASEMMDGGKAWAITKSCKIYKRSSSKADVLGEVVIGQKLVGAQAAGSWVKILNSSGGAAFVKSECGQFE